MNKLVESIWTNRAYPRFHTFHTLRLCKHPEIRSTRYRLVFYSITSPPIQSESFFLSFVFASFFHRSEKFHFSNLFASIRGVSENAHKGDTKKMKRGEYRFSRITLDEFSLHGSFIDKYRIEEFDIFRNFFKFSAFVCYVWLLILIITDTTKISCKISCNKFVV